MNNTKDSKWAQKKWIGNLEKLSVDKNRHYFEVISAWPEKQCTWSKWMEHDTYSQYLHGQPQWLHQSSWQEVPHMLIDCVHPGFVNTYLNWHVGTMSTKDRAKTLVGSRTRWRSYGSSMILEL